MDKDDQNCVVAFLDARAKKGSAHKLTLKSTNGDLKVTCMTFK